ncbi:MAG: class I SAM-dependent methyltransferase [Bacteroidetes bacterium]|nr:class I SAM-dependent methyltransferase [Bacteroidota bacterium]
MNNIFIRFGVDSILTSRFGIYKRIKINTSLSPQQMAGFSEKPTVQEAINKIHDQLETLVQQNLKEGDRILDIGCGPGAYLKKWEGKYDLTGIDINEEMVNAAKKYIPTATFLLDNFLNHDFDHKFKLIYSVSVLEFIPPSRLMAFFRKVHLLLEPDGKLLIQYPHALNFKDTLYPDLYYVEYSPRKIEHELRKNYQIITHEHCFDRRIIDLYDPKPYEPGIRTFKNGYLLIAEPTIKPNN